MNLHWSPRATAARKAAILYIQKRSPVAALGQLDQIERQTVMLLDHPEIGRPGRIKGTLELVISHTPFIIIYRFRPRAKRIDIINFVHGSQQWPSVKIKIN